MHPTNERKRLVGVTETIQRYTDGSITYSKPKENKMKGGWSLYPRDSHNGNILPRWLLPWLPTPFTPAISKFKTDANAFTNADMELSVRDTPDGRLIVAMCTAIDASIRAEVVSRRDGLGEPRQPAVRPRHQQVADRQPEANTFVSKAEVRLGVRSVELVGQRGVIRRFQGQVEAGDERLDDVFEMRTARR